MVGGGVDFLFNHCTGTINFIVIAHGELYDNETFPLLTLETLDPHDDPGRVALIQCPSGSNLTLGALV
jgi:hypothetical protein